jgi:Fe-S cluster assembly protein SufD
VLNNQESQLNDVFESLRVKKVPTALKESWKYTSLSSILTKKLALVPYDASKDTNKSYTSLLPQYLGEDEAYRVCIVNYAINGNCLNELEKKGVIVKVVSYRNLVSCPDQHVRPFEILLSELPTASVTIEVQAGSKLEKPIHIVTILDGKAEPIFAPCRMLVSAGEESNVDIYHSFVTSGTNEIFSVPTTEIYADKRSNVTYSTFVNLPKNIQQIHSTAISAQEKSQVSCNSFVVAAPWVRNEVYVKCEGQNSNVLLQGLSLLSGNEYAENVITIDHEVENCESTQLFKGVYDDTAKGVFTGTIVVREGAQKTNAIQSNKSLVLTPGAQVFTRPQLKIWADDVKCTHGATVGMIDNGELFYLTSRGIPEHIAKYLLQEAFCIDLISKIPYDSVVSFLSELLAEKFVNS